MLGGEKGGRGRLGVEGRGQQSGLEHEADETRAPEQRFVAGEYAMGQRGTASSCRCLGTLLISWTNS
jgi:hypothetical protein